MAIWRSQRGIGGSGSQAYLFGRASFHDLAGWQVCLRDGAGLEMDFDAASVARGVVQSVALGNGWDYGELVFSHAPQRVCLLAHPWDQSNFDVRGASGPILCNLLGQDSWTGP